MCLVRPVSDLVVMQSLTHPPPQVALVALAELGGVIIMSENAWRVLCQADFDPSLVFVLSNWSTSSPIFFGFGESRLSSESSPDEGDP